MASAPPQPTRPPARPARSRARRPSAARGAALVLGLVLVLLGAPVIGILVTPARSEIAYESEITGAPDDDLARTLKDASQLQSLEDRPPPSEAALHRRADDDVARLEQVMQAEGYWSAKLSYAIDAAASPAKVTVTIEPGPLFHFGKIAFEAPDGAPPPLASGLDPATLGLKPGSAARSAPVVDAEAQIVAEYSRKGHPFAKVTSRKVVVDVATRTMDVTYIVNAGPAARFGPLSVEGLERVDRDFVAQRIDWREGASYDGRDVERTRQDLVNTGLFNSVRITPGTALDVAGAAPMTVALVERPPRSIGAGISYNTTLGVGAQAFWEHRNLFGSGEKLRLTAGIAQEQKGAEADFRIPGFLALDQDLVTSAAFLNETPEAYTSRRVRLYAGLERRLTAQITGSLGLSAERANVRQPDTGLTENYSLLGMPLNVKRDATDSLLDPTRGNRETVTLTPYRSFSGPDLTFLTSRLEGRGYQRIGDSDRFVLAGFGALGSIVGPGLDAIPIDKRLFAGGGGSVRGYGFQLAGPLDRFNKPIGGRSSFELGVELRYKVTETIGIVPFIEAGNVYPTSLPNSTKLLPGAGIGLRYYTPIGPLRLDLAVPLQKRSVDSPIQIYVSLGQAF